MSRHPLSKEDEWFFSQHSVRVCAPIFRIVNKKKKSNPRGLRSRKIDIQGSSTCREGIIGNIRNALRTAGGHSIRSSGGPGWQRVFSPYGSLELNRDVLKQPGESSVAVYSSHITADRSEPNLNYRTPKERKAYRNRGLYYPWHERVHLKLIRTHRTAQLTDTNIQDFIDICNAVVGPLTVLLNPDRYQGNWWQTSIGECLAGQRRSNYLNWYGVDNTVIAHPVLTSLYSGLVRQCAYIVRTNLADQIREDIEGMGLEECLNESDEVQALRIATKMKRWICVPPLKGGTTYNIPVGQRNFSKIISLHKAIYKHGFEETFKSCFLKGWGVYNGCYSQYSGIHTFMGVTGQSKNGKHIQKLARKKA